MKASKVLVMFFLLSLVHRLCVCVLFFTVHINDIFHNKNFKRTGDIPILLEGKTQKNVSSQINLEIQCNHKQYPNEIFYGTWKGGSKFHLEEKCKKKKKKRAQRFFQKKVPKYITHPQLLKQCGQRRVQKPQK